MVSTTVCLLSLPSLRLTNTVSSGIVSTPGTLFKIVKYANDVTTSKELKLQMEFEIKQRAENAARTAEEMSRKVAEVLQVVNNVADGNFDLTVPDLGEDAVGQVAKALGVAIDSMRTALKAVRSVASTVSSAASEMTTASTEISKGAQHQTSSLEETASSLEEITSTVKQNTGNAQQARQLANPTSPEESKSETAGKLFAVFLKLIFKDSSDLKSET